MKNKLLSLLICPLFLLSSALLQATVFTVGTARDGGTGSLRQAIIDANADPTATAVAPHTIQFGSFFNFSQRTIYLDRGELVVDNHVRIDGPSVGVVLDARDHPSQNQANHRVIKADSGKTLALWDLVIRHGWSNDEGGAVYCWGDLDLRRCYFHENEADNGGAVFFNNNRSLSARDCTFANNQAQNDGGALFLEAFNGELINCTFSDNVSMSYGGGILNYGSLDLYNCTLTGNSSLYAAGGGIMSFGNTALSNSIVVDSKSGENVDGSINLVGLNIVEGYSDPSLLGGDPNLGPLAFNGGLVPTHALGKGSAALDSGDSSDFPLSSFRDARLMPRVVASGSSQPNEIDLGAVEMPKSFVAYCHLRNANIDTLVTSQAFDVDDELTGVTNPGQQYFYKGSPITNFNPSSVSPGVHLITYNEDESADPLLQSPVFSVTVLDPVIVTSTDGRYSPGSLEEALDIVRNDPSREAIAFNTDPSHGVDFSASQQTIYLDNNDLLIEQEVKIYGPEGVGVVLDGRDSANGSPSNNSVLRLDFDADVHLENLTIQYGGGFEGAGIYSEGDLSLKKCVIRNNYSFSRGGGVFHGNQGGDLRIEDCTFKDNVADFEGGGLYVDSLRGVCEIERATFEANRAYTGGGAYLNRGADLINVTLSGNEVNQEGGAIYHSGDELNLVQCTIARNSVDNSNDTSGVYTNGSLTLTNSIIGDSQSGRDFGGGGANVVGINIVEDGSLGGAWDVDPGLLRLMAYFLVQQHRIVGIIVWQ